ncbi:hypothetical protein PTTG_30258 [Puccinia triticina 1-1 BBBD Race 1]|uniref:Uncharacterized protein n=1 Tax=Puccinia triticina (isolate 1-1 / race 1 (BBBD)) TaxID=630390 RepID=A0A180G1T3_PUCT1|nr:hypothetical protein PTTG_30258 [Puccinia triticina 1-1 BBBD Race 1]
MTARPFASTSLLPARDRTESPLRETYLGLTPAVPHNLDAAKHHSCRAPHPLGQHFLQDHSSLKFILIRPWPLPCLHLSPISRKCSATVPAQPSLAPSRWLVPTPLFLHPCRTTLNIASGTLELPRPLVWTLLDLIPPRRRVSLPDGASSLFNSPLRPANIMLHLLPSPHNTSCTQSNCHPSFPELPYRPRRPLGSVLNKRPTSGRPPQSQDLMKSRWLPPHLLSAALPLKLLSPPRFPAHASASAFVSHTQSPRQPSLSLITLAAPPPYSIHPTSAKPKQSQTSLMAPQDCRSTGTPKQHPDSHLLGGHGGPSNLEPQTH